MAKQKEGSDTFHVRIPDALRDEMLKACKERNITPSQLIREGVSIYLELWLGNKEKRKVSCFPDCKCNDPLKPRV